MKQVESRLTFCLSFFCNFNRAGGTKQASRVIHPAKTTHCDVKAFFLIGSLIVGAAFTIGSTEAATVVWITLIVIGLGLLWFRKSNRAEKAPVETEYSELEVREMYAARSTARSRRVPPLFDPCVSIRQPTTTGRIESGGQSRRASPELNEDRTAHALTARQVLRSPEAPRVRAFADVPRPIEMFAGPVLPPPASPPGQSNTTVLFP